VEEQPLDLLFAPVTQAVEDEKDAEAMPASTQTLFSPTANSSK